MRNPVLSSALGVAVALAATLSPGCKEKNAALPPEGAAGEETVRGKVTFNGEPVPYGVVLFYNHASFDPMTATRRPVAFGTINPDGTYEVTHAPAGPVQICVATDPDADPTSLVRPASAGGAPPGGPMPGAGGPPGGIMGGPPGGPMPPGGPPGGFPTGPGALPGPLPGGGVPKSAAPGKEGPPSAPPASPGALLPVAKQKTLREIHGQYGSPERPKVTYVVKPGEQTFNIVLK